MHINIKTYEYNIKEFDNKFTLHINSREAI